MRTVCLCLRAHLSCRLRHYTVFDIGRVHDYEDGEATRRIVEDTATNSLEPVNTVLYDLVARYGGALRVAISLSGPALTLLARYRPDCLDGFRRLAATGAVEFTGETYYHSLASHFSEEEFRRQVAEHRDTVAGLFGRDAACFRPVGLIGCHDEVRILADMGFRSLLMSAREKEAGGTMVPAHRRPSRSGTIAVFVGAAAGLVALADVEMQYLDYDAVGLRGKHCHDENNALARLAGRILDDPDARFRTPSEIVASAATKPGDGLLTVAVPAHGEEELAPWYGNALQRDALTSIYALERDALACGDAGLLQSWRMLQNMDFIRAMHLGVQKCERLDASPYESYISYMNILDDLSSALRGPSPAVRKGKRRQKPERP